MTRLVLLRGTGNPDWSLPLQLADTFQDSEALLERIRSSSGRIAWVAIAPDLDDPPDIARQIRAADSSIGVILLGADRESGAVLPLAPLPEILGEAAKQTTLQRSILEAEKLASFTALTAEIAHEVGAPMTAILGYAELLAKSIGDEKNRKRATTIVEQVARVRELLETLMNLSRMEERSFFPLEPAGILDKALDFYRAKFRRCGIEVERHYDPVPRILGDPGRLHRALLSLFLNALKAMPQGGELRVSLAEREDAAEVEIRVSGSGWKIDSELRERIFEPHLSTNPRAGGPGVGLFVAKALIEEHGGKMTLASADRGAEFRLIFPRLAESREG
jgi:two-component system sensor histidine kinase HydH